MKILLIEDDLNKARHIASMIQGAFRSVAIIEKHSYTSGLEAARETSPDAIVLDMSMPTYDVQLAEDGGRSRAFAGRQILHKLLREGVSTSVVIVTQFETFIEGAERMTLRELETDLRRQFPRNYLGTVFYQAGSSTWGKELVKLLAPCVRITKTSQ